MRLVITHLTRMSYPRICVAGLEQATKRYIRPIVGMGDNLEVGLVGDQKPMALGNVVDLGWNEMRGSPPETEDCYFKLRNARVVGRLNPEQFWQLLESAVQSRITAIFGDDLKPHKRTLVVPVHKGKASLGDILVSKLRLDIEQYQDKPPKLRGVFTVNKEGQKLTLSVAVTDIRFYKPRDSFWELDQEKVEKIQQKLSQNPKVILSVGLSRPIAFAVDEEPAHWFQINGIHLEGDPLWK